jgi:hypothetical protein
MADPAVRRQVFRLRRDWRNLSHVERGDLLRTLAAAGCSTRGLAEATGSSATTVRRYLEIASLPEEIRHDVENGTSAKTILESRASERRRRSTLERLRVERQTGEFSDALADVLIEFGKGELGSRVRMTRDEFPMFLAAVAREVRSLDAFGRGRDRISKKLDLKAQLKTVKPKPPKNDNLIEERAEWMARFIRARFPESMIWERALEKSAKREKELVPVRTLADSVRAKSWGPRLINIPPRPVTRPAREVMKRQGRKPTQQSSLAVSNAI